MIRTAISFATSKAGIAVIAIAAFAAWSQYQRWDAARDAEAAIVARIQEAVLAERIRQEAVVEAVFNETELTRNQDRAELEKLREITNELIANQVDQCIIPDDVLERLRAIN